MSVRSADPSHEPSPLPNGQLAPPRSSLSPCSRISCPHGPSTLPCLPYPARLDGRKQGGFLYPAIPACVLPGRHFSLGYLTRVRRCQGGGLPPGRGPWLSRSL